MAQTFVHIKIAAAEKGDRKQRDRPFARRFFDKDSCRCRCFGSALALCSNSRTTPRNDQSQNVAERREKRNRHRRYWLRLRRTARTTAKTAYESCHLLKAESKTQTTLRSKALPQSLQSRVLFLRPQTLPRHRHSIRQISPTLRLYRGHRMHFPMALTRDTP